jgi:hypothetical protein
MATLQQKIAETFLAKITASKEIDAVKVEQLKVLLSAGKKPKIDDFVKLFSLPVGGDVK